MISSWSWPRHSRHFFQNTSRKSNNAAKCSKAVETPFSCQVTLTAFENELGVQAPVGFWDPAGFTADGDVAVFKRRRSVELKHGRISMMATMGDLDALLIHVFEDTTEDATSTFPKAGPNFKHRTAWLLVSWHDRCNKYVWWHVFGFSFEQLLCCCFVFHGSRDLWNWMLHDVGMFCADAFARIHYSRSHWQAARDSVHMSFRFFKRDVIATISLATDMSVPLAPWALNDLGWRSVDVTHCFGLIDRWSLI